MKKIEQTVDENLELIESDVLEFFLALNKRILHRRDAFLLSNLLENIKTLSELNGLMKPIISNTRTIKRRGAINKFSNDISFYPKVKYKIVHSSNFTPCEYVLAILRGKRLKDYGIITSFGEMIRRKLRDLQKKSKVLNDHKVLKRLLRCYTKDCYLKFKMQFCILFMKNM